MRAYFFMVFSNDKDETNHLSPFIDGSNKPRPTFFFFTILHSPSLLSFNCNNSIILSLNYFAAEKNLASTKNVAATKNDVATKM